MPVAEVIRTADPRVPLTLRNGSAVFLAALASLVLINLSPILVSALGTLGFSVLSSGNILTATLLAAAVVGLSTARLAAGAHRRRLASWGLAISTVAYAVAAVVPDPLAAVVALVVGGGGAGAAISTSGAALAALRNPNRVSATSGLVNRLLVTAVLAALPAIGIAQASAFGALALISLAALLVCRWLPEAPGFGEPVRAGTADAVSAGDRRTTSAGLALLVVFALWGISEDAVWSMARVLGERAGLGDQALGLAVSLAAAGGISGVVLVIIFGRRIGRAAPLAIALLAGGALKMQLGFANDPVVFAVLLVCINSLYAFAFALFLATGAGLDARGRWSSPLLGAYLVGSSFAPLVGGALIEWLGPTGFTPLMGAISLLAIIPTALIARASTAAETSSVRAAN